VLTQKGHVRYEEEGLRYVYSPAVPRHTARRASLGHLVQTFHGGSAVQVVTDLLERRAFQISGDDIERIAAIVATTAEKRRIRQAHRMASGAPEWFHAGCCRREASSSRYSRRPSGGLIYSA
jgi:Penicillinase repressor